MGHLDADFADQLEHLDGIGAGGQSDDVLVADHVDDRCGGSAGNLDVVYRPDAIVEEYSHCRRVWEAQNLD